MSSYHHTSSRRKNATKHVFIAIPTYGDIPAKAVHSLLAAKDHLIANDVSVDIAILEGNCHVDDARNDLVRLFLETECTDLLFIDSDVVYSHSAALQLLKHPVDIVGGSYPYKDDSESFPVEYLPSREVPVVHDTLIEVAGMPTGFLRISREAMKAAYSLNSGKGTWFPKGNYKAKIPMAEVFYRGYEPIGVGKGGATLKRRSGDYQFCRDMRKAGWHIYCDPNLTFGHMGMAQSTGNLGKKLMEPHQGTILPQQLNSLRTNRARASIEVRASIIGYVADTFGNKPFAADAMLLDYLFMTASQPDVIRVLETGTGVSTAILQASDKAVISLEADPVWAAKTAGFLGLCGLSSTGIKVCPITETPSGPWYSFKEGSYRPDMIFVDGPHRTEAGMRARFMDVLPNMVRHAKYVVVDDVDDGDGRALIARLSSEFGFSVDVYENPARRDFAVAVRI